MKAIILSGGFAKRFWPITLERPKSLLPVAGRPVLDYTMEKLLAVDEVAEILISTNRRFATCFEEWLTVKGFEKARIVVEETFEEREKIGSIGALYHLFEEVGEEDSLVVGGDNLFTFDLLGLVHLFYEKRHPVVGLFDVVGANQTRRYGVVTLDTEGRIVGLQEKPRNVERGSVSTAIYAFPGETRRWLKEYLNLDQPGDSPGYFLEWLSLRKEMYGYKFVGSWWDIGDLDTYIQANRDTMEGYVKADNTIVRNQAEIRPPVFLEHNVRIEGRSVVGPYTHLCNGCVLEDSEVTSSVVFEHSSIADSSIVDCVIGDHCHIKGLNLTSSLLGCHTKVYCRERGHTV